MKTTIKIIAIVCFVCSTYTVQAQKLSFGVEGAIAISSVKISGIPGSFTDAISGKGIMSYQGGAFLRFGSGASLFYLKPKLLLEVQKGDLQYVVNETNQSIKFSVAKLLTPVLLGLKIVHSLSVEAGPVFDQVISSTKDINGNAMDIGKTGFGYRVGLDAYFAVLNFTVSYQGMKNSGSLASLATYETPEEVIFGAGIRF